MRQTKGSKSIDFLNSGVDASLVKEWTLTRVIVDVSLVEGIQSSHVRLQCEG